MQSRTGLQNQELVSVRSSWTERERVERTLLAQQKQRWLAELIGIETRCRETEQPVVALAKAG